MFTTAVQVGPNGSHDLPIPFPKSQCVRLNSRRPVYEVGLRPREMLAHLTGSASGSHVRHEGERFAPRTFVPPGLGSLTEEPPCDGGGDAIVGQHVGEVVVQRRAGLAHLHIDVDAHGLRAQPFIEACRAAVQQINGYLARNPSQGPAAITETQRTLLANRYGLDAGELAEVSSLFRLAVATTGVLGLMVTAIVVLAPPHSRPAGYHPLAIAVVSTVVVVMDRPHRYGGPSSAGVARH